MFSIHIYKAMSELRVIISGGGTGGHIFPAISIANAIREKDPQAKILFIGAENRMEMQRVPAAGYKIIGLPIAGFDRTHLWKNISVLFKIWQSRRKARAIVREFRPDVAVGVGGFLPIVVGDDHRGHQESALHELLAQAEHILIVGDAEVLAHFVLLNVERGDDNHYLHRIAQLGEHC